VTLAGPPVDGEIESGGDGGSANGGGGGLTVGAVTGGKPVGAATGAAPLGLRRALVGVVSGTGGGGIVPAGVIVVGPPDGTAADVPVARGEGGGDTGRRGPPLWQPTSMKLADTSKPQAARRILRMPNLPFLGRPRLNSCRAWDRLFLRQRGNNGGGESRQVQVARRNKRVPPVPSVGRPLPRPLLAPLAMVCKT
jgi:hypothetical protein